MVFIGPACKVLYSRCQTNNGLPLDIVAGKLKRSSGAASSPACVTSYKVEILKTTPRIDFGVFEK